MTVDGNDSPNGFVSLGSPTIVATENSVITVPVLRRLGKFSKTTKFDITLVSIIYSSYFSAGLFRNISVIYSTAASLLPSAMAGNDYVAIIGEEVIIEEGSSRANITVTILADDLPELNETFRLSLVSVSFAEELPEDSGEGGPQLGAITTSEITIRENDDPYGRFTITGSGGESVVRVAEVGSLGVSLLVTREAGRVGEVEVTWSVTGGSAVENVDFGGECIHHSCV